MTSRTVALAVVAAMLAITTCVAWPFRGSGNPALHFATLGWCVLPFAIWGVLWMLARSPPALAAMLVLGVAMSVAGVVVLLALMHKPGDGLNAMIMYLVPGFQAGVLILLGVPLLLILNRQTGMT